MKIALTHYSSPPVIGGVESVLARHALLMTEAGHAVRIIAGRGQPFDRRIHYLSIPQLASQHTTVLDVKRELDCGVVSTAFAGLTAEITRRLRTALEGVDLLIAHNVGGLHKNLAFTMALKAISTEVPLILWHHDLAWTSSRYQGELHAGDPWYLLRLAWPGVRQVTISAQRQAEIVQLQGIDSAEVAVIPNGIDTPRFLKLGEQAREIVSDFELAEAEPLLLLPVRITQRKNIELALRVVASLRAAYPGVMLVVTGPQGAHNPQNLSYFDSLRALRDELGLQDSVVFLAERWDASVSDETIADLCRVADALFLPSWEEGFGLPMLEAGLSGLPVFSSQIESLSELGKEDAFSFDPADEPEAIAKLIVTTLSSDAQYRFKVRVRKNFSWQSIYDKMIAPLIAETK
jgi:glycosyltransferase involved in cell wall biosynthesis